MQTKIILTLLVMLATYGLINAAQFGGGEEQAPSAESTHFQVSSAGGTSVLLETQTGKSWLLNSSANYEVPAVWIPIRRLETRQEVRIWFEEEQARINENEHQLKKRQAEEATTAVEPEKVLPEDVAIPLEKELINLEIEEELAREKLSRNHPTVREMQKKIAIYQKHLSVEPEKTLPKSDLTSLEKNLIDLQLEEEILQQKYGSDHPSLVALRSKIEFYQKRLAAYGP